MFPSVTAQHPALIPKIRKPGAPRCGAPGVAPGTKLLPSPIYAPVSLAPLSLGSGLAWPGTSLGYSSVEVVLWSLPSSQN